MQKIRLRNNNVAVQRVQKTEKKVTSGGFVVPTVLDDLGQVVYVSPEIPDLKPGDMVYFGPKAEPIRIQGNEVLIMESSNIFGVVEDGENQPKEEKIEAEA